MTAQAGSSGARIEWDAAAPEPLRARMTAALGRLPDESRDRSEASRCVDAAIALLDELLAREGAGREAALDLLTVDALVTYAFEAAARQPATLDALAARAMIRASSPGVGSSR